MHRQNILRQTLAVAVVIAVLASVALPIITPIARSESTTNEEDTPRLRIRALVLQNMLRRALALNISRELLAEIETLVNLNVSSLTHAELREYIARCKEVMARVEQEVRRSWTADLGSIYAQRIRAAIESRLRIMARLYNITLDEEIANISRARSIEELWRALKHAEKALERARARRFAEQVFKRTEVVMNTTIEKPEALDIKRAFNELGVATEVLNRVAKRLEKLNISREATEHIRIAIEHISIAKQILGNISINLTTAVPEKVRVREIANKTLEKLYSRVSETLEEVAAEIEELIERALELNATEALEDLEQLKQRVENLTQLLQQTSIDIEQLRKIMLALAKVRLELKEISEELKRGIEVWIPEASIDKAFNTTLRRALDNVNTVKEMISYIENKSKDIVCIAVYPPPPICRYIQILPQLLNRSRDTVSKVEDIINKALELYNSGYRIQALHLVVRANAMLINLRAWLEPVYNMFKLAEKAREGFDKGRGELTTRLERILERLKDIEERLSRIVSKLDDVRGPARVAIERTVNEIRTLVGQVNELIERARNALDSGDSSSASEAIAKIESLLRQAETKLSMIEKLLR